MSKLDELAEQVRALSPDERRTIAAVALDFPAPGSSQFDAEWEEELDRRIQEIDAGKVEFLDGEAALREISRELGL